MIGRLKRLSERDWDVLDRVLAAVLFVAMALNLTLGHRYRSLAPELLLAAVIAGALLWRRKNALLMVVVVMSAAAVLLSALTTPSNASSVAAVVIVAGYSSGAHLDLRRSLAAFVLIIGAVLAVCLVRTPTGIFFPLVFFGIVPWVVGRVIRTQTALARELTEKAEREQFAREQEEARAAAAERARVARELHDVLAHNLSVMVIQASAAKRVADHDPGAAAEAAELISRTGREALSELRYVFGPVRKQDGDTFGVSPGLANIDKLASSAHRAGLPVQMRVEGKPIALSPGADLAAYRVVQEALTNSLRHGRGCQATVIVRHEPGGVVLEVLDDGAGAAVNGNREDGGGHGLVGMRERIALYGGELEAGTRQGGGFAVRARLPVGDALP